MFDMKIDDVIGETVARRSQGIPAGLDEMEPGPFLGIVLSGIDLDPLSGDDRITVMRARQRMASHHAARAVVERRVVDRVKPRNVVRSTYDVVRMTKYV